MGAALGSDATRPGEQLKSRMAAAVASANESVVLGHRPVWGLEGGIAVGKTTAAEQIAAVLSGRHGRTARVYYEDMNAALLALFYAHPKEEAFSFQLHTQNNRLHHMADARRCAKSGETVIMDRSTWGDAVFAHMHAVEGNIAPAQMDVYLSLARSPPHKLAATEATPDLILYLDVVPEIAHDRMIHLRKTPSESVVPLAYLEQLDAVYVRRVIVQLASANPNVVVVNWDSFGNAEDLAHKMIDATDTWCKLRWGALVAKYAARDEAALRETARELVFKKCSNLSAEQVAIGIDAFVRRVRERICDLTESKPRVTFVGALSDAEAAEPGVYRHLAAVGAAYARRTESDAYGTYSRAALPWCDNALATSNALRRVAMDELARGRDLVFYGVGEADLAVLRGAVRCAVEEPLRVL